MKSYTPLPTWALRGYMHTIYATCVYCKIIYIFTYMVSTCRTWQVSSWSHCQIKWFTSFRFPRLQLNPWHCKCPLTKVCFQQSHVHLFVLQVWMLKDLGSHLLTYYQEALPAFVDQKQRRHHRFVHWSTRSLVLPEHQNQPKDSKKCPSIMFHEWGDVNNQWRNLNKHLSMGRFRLHWN